MTTKRSIRNLLGAVGVMLLVGGSGHGAFAADPLPPNTPTDSLGRPIQFPLDRLAGAPSAEPTAYGFKVTLARPTGPVVLHVVTNADAVRQMVPGDVAGRVGSPSNFDANPFKFGEKDLVLVRRPNFEAGARYRYEVHELAHLNPRDGYLNPKGLRGTVCEAPHSRQSGVLAPHRTATRATITRLPGGESAIHDERGYIYRVATDLEEQGANCKVPRASTSKFPVGRTCAGIGIAALGSTVGGIVGYETGSPTAGIVTSTGIGVGGGLATVGLRAMTLGAVPALIGVGAEYCVMEATGNEGASILTGVCTATGIGFYFGGPYGALAGTVTYSVSKLGSELSVLYGVWRDGQAIDAVRGSLEYRLLTVARNYGNWSPRMPPGADREGARELEQGATIETIRERIQRSADTRSALVRQYTEVFGAAPSDAITNSLVEAMVQRSVTLPDALAYIRVVNESYLGFLNRPPTQADIELQIRALETGVQGSWRNLIQSVARSPEADAVANDLITKFYRTLLGREPGPGEVAAWRAKMLEEGLPLAAVQKGFLESPERKIIEAYQDYLNRAPNVGSCGQRSAEVAFHMDLLAKGVPLEAVLDGIRKSTERSLSVGTFVKDTLRYLIGHEPSEAEIASAVKLAEERGLTMVQIVEELRKSPERAIIEEFVRRFGRLPHPDCKGGVSPEIARELARVQAGESLESVLQSMRDSDAAKKHAEDGVRALYERLFLRAPIVTEGADPSKVGQVDPTLFAKWVEMANKGEGLVAVEAEMTRWPETAIAAAYLRHVGRLPTAEERDKGIEDAFRTGNVEDAVRAIQTSPEATEHRTKALAGWLESTAAGVSTEDLPEILAAWDAFMIAYDMTVESLVAMFDTAGGAPIDPTSCESPDEEADDTSDGSDAMCACYDDASEPDGDDDDTADVNPVVDPVADVPAVVPVETTPSDLPYSDADGGSPTPTADTSDADGGAPTDTTSDSDGGAPTDYTSDADGGAPTDTTSDSDGGAPQDIVDSEVEYTDAGDSSGGAPESSPEVPAEESWPTEVTFEESTWSMIPIAEEWVTVKSIDFDVPVEERIVWEADTDEELVERTGERVSVDNASSEESMLLSDVGNE